MRGTGAEILVACLIKQGVDVVFGMPGTHTVALYDALYQKRRQITHILVRNEQNASLMAEGYARVAGKPGVCLPVPGPGASNAATGIAEAYCSSTPVLLVTSCESRALLGKDSSKLFHGLNHTKFFEPITKWRAAASDPKEIPTLVEEAFRQMLNGRPAPVMLVIPRDVLESRTQARIPARVERESLTPDAEQIDLAVELLRSSKRPIIIAGDGIIHDEATALLRRFCEQTKIPVTTLQRARGAIPDDHPLSLGDISRREARTAVESADLCLALGCKFTYFDTAGFELKLPEKLIRIDADESELEKDYPPQVKILGCCRAALEKMLSGLRKRKYTAPATWRRRIEKLCISKKDKQKAVFFEVLRAGLPRDAIVAVDVHMTGYKMRREFPVYEPDGYLSSGCYVTLGYAIPAAIGAKCAAKNRDVIAVVGDGGFMTSCVELATAAQFDIDITVLVFNDRCFTSIKRIQEQRYGKRYIGVDLRNPDFVTMVQSFGILAVRASSLAELPYLLIMATAWKAPCVIEFPIEND